MHIVIAGNRLTWVDGQDGEKGGGFGVNERTTKLMFEMLDWFLTPLRGVGLLKLCTVAGRTDSYVIALENVYS